MNAARARFGFWASLGTAVSTSVAFAAAVATPPLSGPWCTAGCFSYPYLEIAGRFPRDYLWMPLAMVSTVFFVAFVVSLRARAPGLGAELAVVVGAMGAFAIIADYAVQLAVVNPSLLAQEHDGVALLTQYNPHGVFVALEELGYSLITLSLGCAGLGLRRTRVEQAVRAVFAAGVVLGAGALAFFAARYGHHREYLFEVAIISIAWLALIAGATLMTFAFRRRA